MRIASDFHDYYDVVMGEGMDTSLVYQRYAKTEELEHYPWSGWFHSRYSREPETLTIRQYTVGFCGRVYPVLEINDAKYANRNDKEARSHRKLVFSLEDIDSYVRHNFPKDYEAYATPNGWRSARKGFTWSWNQRRNDFERFYERHAENQDRYTKIFEERRCPVFVAEYNPKWEKNKEIRQGIVTWNSPLKPFEFYRIKDSYQAFQEIAMWLGNQAEPRKPIPPISDEDMVEIKGFDKKTSFRKPPSKKK